MAFLRKTFASGLFIGFFIGLFSLVTLLAGGILYYRDNPGGRLSQWGKDQAKRFAQAYHPLAQLRSYAHEVKSNLNTPSALAHSTFSFQKVGFPGSRVEQSGSLVTWIAPFSDRVPPDDTPPSGQVREAGKTRPLELTGLRGETLSFQLVLKSNDPLENLTLSLVPDSSTGSNCIQVHRFFEIYMKLMVHQGGKYGPLKEVINPDPLVPFTDPYTHGHRLISAVKLTGDRNQPIWFDVHYSRSCPARTFSGHLEVRQAGTLVRKTAVKFTVLNATLPHEVGLDRWMEFYTSRFWHGEEIPNDDAFRKLLHRYFQVSHQYGFSTNGCGDIGPDIRWDWNTGKAISVDWSTYDRIMGPEVSGELTGRKPNAWCFPIRTYSLGVGNWGGFMIEGGSPSPIENWQGIPDIATQSLASLIVQHWKEKGWPLNHGFVYAFDEPGHQLVYYPDIYKLIADVATSIHKGSHNQMRFMLTDDPWIWYKTQAGHDKSIMYDKVDIWSPNASSYIPDRIHKYQEKGARAWFYQSGPPFTAAGDLSSTGIGFRMWFWTAWKYRSNGVFYWAANFWHGNTRAVNPYTNGGGGDGEMYYPGHQLHFLGLPDIDGPVPSIRMAQWRRGYEDYKYLYMLKQKGHGNDADKSVNRLVKHALNDGGYIPYWRNPLWEKAGDWNHDPKAWHKARLALAHEIEKLYGK